MDATGHSQDATVVARRDVVLEWLSNLDPEGDAWESTLSPVAMTVVDALLAADGATLQELTDPVRDALVALFDDGAHAREVRGYLTAMLAIIRWGLQRLPDPGATDIDRDTHAWKLLTALSDAPRLSSAELRERLRTNDSQVSRVGRQLLAHGLVAQRRAGRTAVWELTPRGHQLLRKEGDGQQSRTR
jgi:hypothetical protein